MQTILGDKLEDVKPRLSKIQSLKKKLYNHMLYDPHEDLEKLNPLHAQLDTGCNKGKTPLSRF